MTIIQKKMQKVRCEQGSNLRGKIPLDFKSNALTTRPSQLPSAYELNVSLAALHHMTFIFRLTTHNPQYSSNVSW